jgi:membrane protease YdiL (CAAX protease family)
MGAPRRPPPDVTAAALALAWGAITHRAVPARLKPAAGIGAAITLTALAHASGADWRDLGCDRRDLRAGLRAGVVTAGAIVAATFIARTLDRRGTAFRDARVEEASAAEAAVHLLVRIPFATALAEELVFRGVILGLGLRAGDRRRAMLVSAVSFGLWHVGAALHPERQRTSAGVVGDRLAPTIAVVGADVAATTVGGLGFGWLRLRTGSIAAPVIAHAVLNGSAYVATRRNRP